jgi:hypothetical protein
MNDVVSLRQQADRCERLASRISDPTVAQNLRDLAVEYSARAAACSEVRSLLEKAAAARAHALQAAFADDRLQNPDKPPHALCARNTGDWEI